MFISFSDISAVQYTWHIHCQIERNIYSWTKVVIIWIIMLFFINLCSISLTIKSFLVFILLTAGTRDIIDNVLLVCVYRNIRTCSFFCLRMGVEWEQDQSIRIRKWARQMYDGKISSWPISMISKLWQMFQYLGWINRTHY